MLILSSMVLSFLNNGMILVISFENFILVNFFHILFKTLLLMIDIVQRRIVLFLPFNYIDGDGTKISPDERHAALRFALHKDRAAATEAVSVMLTRHAIASVYSSEHVAGEFSRWLFSRLVIASAL